jgi:hypothetical protein
VSEHPAILEKSSLKMAKNGIFTILAGFKVSPKNLFLSFLQQKLMLTYPQNRKKTRKMGNLIIFEEIMTVKSCHVFDVFSRKRP